MKKSEKQYDKAFIYFVVQKKASKQKHAKNKYLCLDKDGKNSITNEIREAIPFSRHSVIVFLKGVDNSYIGKKFSYQELMDRGMTLNEINQRSNFVAKRGNKKSARK